MDYKDIVRVNKNVKEKLITKKDDLLVCARNGSARLIGKNAILHETDANQTFGAFMMVFRSDKNHFVHQLLNTRRYSSQVSENLGARINQITSSDLSSFEFFFPKENNEMNKISALLDLLDERIATQNKIIDKLQSLIKGISSRIFASIQGIEYKMGDIVTITNGNSNVQDTVTQSKDGLYPFFDRSEDIKYLPTFLFDKEAIIYPGEGTEFMPRYFKGKFALHQRCYVIFDFNEIINARFLYFYLKTRNSYFVKNAVGSTVPSLRLDTFQKLKVIIPSKKIQHSVSLCLSSMEQKCNVEKKILHKLLKQKQYLLRQMFI
jgi:type I restriction enzyme, S subunit